LSNLEVIKNLFLNRIIRIKINQNNHKEGRGVLKNIGVEEKEENLFTKYLLNMIVKNKK